MKIMHLISSEKNIDDLKFYLESFENICTVNQQKRAKIKSKFSPRDFKQKEHKQTSDLIVYSLENLNLITKYTETLEKIYQSDLEKNLRSQLTKDGFKCDFRLFNTDLDLYNIPRQFHNYNLYFNENLMGLGVLFPFLNRVYFRDYRFDKKSHCLYREESKTVLDYFKQRGYNTYFDSKECSLGHLMDKINSEKKSLSKRKIFIF